MHQRCHIMIVQAAGATSFRRRGPRTITFLPSAGPTARRLDTMLCHARQRDLGSIKACDRQVRRAVSKDWARNMKRCPPLIMRTTQGSIGLAIQPTPSSRTRLVSRRGFAS